MDRPEINKNARAINIKAKSKREFFLIHGYTGSPTDFNELGRYLNRRFNANVKIIRLKGHGEKIENLDNVPYLDFLKQAERELKKEIMKGREIVIGGISIGSLIALQLSAKYPVKGILNISIPYRYKFLIGIIVFFEPVIFKKHWKKPIPKYEKELRKNAFFYDMSLLGFRIIKQAKKELRIILNKVIAPCLIIYVTQDKVFHKKSAEIVKDKISSKIKDIVIFEEKGEASHNPFYSPNPKKLYKVIGDFVERNKLFSK